MLANIDLLTILSRQKLQLRFQRGSDFMQSTRLNVDTSIILLDIPFEGLKKGEGLHKIQQPGEERPGVVDSLSLHFL